MWSSESRFKNACVRRLPALSVSVILTVRTQNLDVGYSQILCQCSASRGITLCVLTGYDRNVIVKEQIGRFTKYVKLCVHSPLLNFQ